MKRIVRLFSFADLLAQDKDKDENLPTALMLPLKQTAFHTQVAGR